MVDLQDQADSDSEASEQLRSRTLEFLFETSSEAFKQQSDLDESVWRSMPFIGALFGFAISIIGSVSERHAFSYAPADISYFVSITSFCAAFFYVCLTVVIRNFEYPAKTSETRDYAHKLTGWYKSNKEHHQRIDAKVVDDMRRFMVDQLASANETNLTNVRKRLIARSRAIQFLLFGFFFISVSEMLIFTFDRLSSNGASHHASSPAQRSPSGPNNKTP
jgi:predicted PurR-regulated permease PerM